MSANPFYLISILTSSLLAFFLWSLVIALAFRLFSITSHRTKASLRLIPFLGLVIDFVASQYSISYWINPLSCASCIQKFFLVVFFPELKAYLFQHHLSLVEYLGGDYQHQLFSGLLITFLAASVFLGIRPLIQAFFFTSFIKRLLKNSTACTRSITNSLLKEALQKHSAKVYASQEIAIPFASYNQVVVLPQSMVNLLSQPEFEAVIAHELEHIKSRDPLVRMLQQCIAAFFWWVPTYSWSERMKQDQEMACDQKALSYGLDQEAMASALLKSARQASTSHAAICYLSSSKNPIKARLQMLLGLRSQCEETIFGWSFFGVVAGALFFTMCFILF